MMFLVGAAGSAETGQNLRQGELGHSKVFLGLLYLTSSFDHFCTSSFLGGSPVICWWACTVWDLQKCTTLYSHFFLHILVGGLEHYMFFHILGIVTPTDYHIFQRGRRTNHQPVYPLVMSK
jgi:hypothetical protein